MPGNARIEDYERALSKMVKEEMVKCPKCGNDDDFMVNEIGHVFCNICYTKIPMLSLNERI
jgi:ribosomal protein S27E